MDPAGDWFAAVVARADLESRSHVPSPLTRHSGFSRSGRRSRRARDSNREEHPVFWITHRKLKARPEPRGQLASSVLPQAVTYPLVPSDIWGDFRGDDQKSYRRMGRKRLNLQGYAMVDAAGIEPATPTMST